MVYSIPYSVGSSAPATHSLGQQVLLSVGCRLYYVVNQPVPVRSGSRDIEVFTAPVPTGTAVRLHVHVRGCACTLMTHHNERATPPQVTEQEATSRTRDRHPVHHASMVTLHTATVAPKTASPLSRCTQKEKSAGAAHATTAQRTPPSAHSPHSCLTPLLSRRPLPPNPHSHAPLARPSASTILRRSPPSTPASCDAMGPVSRVHTRAI